MKKSTSIYIDQEFWNRANAALKSRHLEMGETIRLALTPLVEGIEQGKSVILTEGGIAVREAEKELQS
jgi:hypothetical protein